jgi:enoyl-CoA hydratase/carnithine racemase
MNAIDPEMFDALIEAGEKLKSRADVRAVVLSGSGRAFCAGIDMRRFGDAAGSGSTLPIRLLAPRTHGIANEPQKAVLLWRELAGAGLHKALSARVNNHPSGERRNTH